MAVHVSEIAIAIFVKTPGVSPVKTRLAASIGRAKAERFYGLCTDAVEAVVLRAARELEAAPYWAVAESESLEHSRWQRFERIPQGTGGLGERLDRVYRSLLARHARVILLGADAPLISPDLLSTAVSRLRDDRTPFAMSRAGDGGYSLFAGSKPLPAEVWTTPQYSTSETADAFCEELRPNGRVAELPTVDDVDTIEDLPRFLQSAKTRSLLPEQSCVVEYARQLLIDVSGDG